jgi:hypothetical protein
MLSIDPVTTDANTGGSFNRYVYAGNNPYKYIDPDGRDMETAHNPMERERDREQRSPYAVGCGFTCHGVSSLDAGSKDTGSSSTAAASPTTGDKSDSSAEHEYTWKVFRCMGDCAKKTMGELLRNPAPSAMYSAQIKSGDISTVSIGGYTLGKIMTAVDPGTKTIWNLTLPGHILYPGWVRRDVVVQGGATWVVNTGGGGGFNPLNLNSLLAPIVWGGASPARGP